MKDKIKILFDAPSDRAKYILSIFGLILFFIPQFREFFVPGTILNASDTMTQDYYWQFFFQEQLRSSPTFLSWNPHLNGGASIFGGLHLIFIPITLFSDLFFPAHFAITFSGMVHLFLAGIFTLVYGRMIGLSFRVSFVVALFFIMSTQLVSLFNAGHIGKLNTICYLPLVLCVLERALRKRRFIDFTLISIALSLQLYEGHLQISFYTCIVVAIYFIWRTFHIYRDEGDKKVIARMYGFGVLLVLLFFLLSAASISHWLEFKEQSDRSAGTSYEFATSWSMAKKELATYVVPQLFGLSRENYQDPGKIKAFYWGSGLPFTQTANYLGLIPLILTVVALFKSRNRYVHIFLGLATLFMIIAMGKYTPIYPVFYNLGFKFFRVPKMNLFIFAFSIAIIAGFGLQWLLGKLKEGDRKFYKRTVFSVIACAAILALVGIIGEFNKDSLVQYFLPYLRSQGRSFNPSLAIVRYEYALEGIWLAATFFLLSAFALSLRLTNRINRNIFVGVLIFIFFIDVYSTNIKFLDTVPVEGNVYLEKDTAIKYFEKNPGLYRVFNAVRDWQNEKYLSYRITNKYMRYKMHSVTGYEAVQAVRYNGYLNQMSFNSNLVDLFNVKYLVIGKNEVTAKVGDQLGKYTVVVDEDVKILRNNNVIPRAFPVHRAMTLDSERNILMRLTNPKFDPRQVVLLEEKIDMPLSSSPRPASESKVNIVSYENTRIKVDADMADNGFIVFGEKHYTGWNAYLDGQNAKIYLADYALRALYVPKGHHKIELLYEPASNRTSLYITFGSFFFVFSLLLKHAITRYRKPVSEAPRLQGGASKKQ